MWKSFAIALLAGSCFIASTPAQDSKAKDQDRQQARNRNGQSGKMNRRGRQAGWNPNVIFQRLDKNQDGQLSTDELPSRFQNRLIGLDRDQNGAISLNELITGMRNKAQAGAAANKNKADSGNAKRARSMGSPQNVAAVFKRMDRNGDGVISKDEMPQRMQTRFAKMDKNGNDQLDKNEVVGVLEIMKAQGGNKGGRYNTDSSKTKPVKPKRPPRN